MAAERYFKIGPPFVSKGLYVGDAGGTVQVYVDPEAIARWLGGRAFRNQNGRASACGGGVMVVVVTRNPRKD